MSGQNKVMIDVGAESEVENDCLMQKSIDWNNLPFVKPNKVLVTEYWEFVALVAPTAIEKKEWNKGDAICTYCMKCKMKIQWSIKNPKQVQCHMDKYHTKFLAQLTKRKEASSTMAMESKTMQHFFSKKLKKDLLPAQKGDQMKGEALLVNWVAKSLRPFTIIEDSGFQDMVDFLCSLN
jgi:hypothetical protein